MTKSKEKRLHKRIEELEIALRIIRTWCHFEPKKRLNSFVVDIEKLCGKALEDKR